MNLIERFARVSSHWPNCLSFRKNFHNENRPESHCNNNSRKEIQPLYLHPKLKLEGLTQKFQTAARFWSAFLGWTVHAADATPQDPHVFRVQILTVSMLRDMFSDYDVDLSMSHDTWMEEVFQNLSLDVLQKPLGKLIHKEQKRKNLNEPPIEVRFLITSGTVEEVFEDIENKRIKKEFCTCYGIMEDVANCPDLAKLPPKCHHVQVNKLKINVPESKTKLTPTVFNNLEWTEKRYRILAGVFNDKYECKIDPTQTTGYQFHLIDDVNALIQLDGKRKPMELIGWWSHPLSDKIETNWSHNPIIVRPPKFNGKEMLEYALNVPLIRLTYGAYPFPIKPWRKSAYGSRSNHVPWTNLPHPNQEDIATDTKLQIHTATLGHDCHGTEDLFLKRHLRSFPGTFKHKYGSKVTLGYLEAVFQLDFTKLETFRDQLDTTTLCIETPQFDPLTMFLYKGGSPTSITQPHPGCCPDVYSTWPKIPYPIIITEKSTYSVFDPKKPWTKRGDILEKKKNAERLAGGSFSEEMPYTSFQVNRNILLYDWFAQVFLDIENHKPRHLEGIFPRRVHANPIYDPQGNCNKQGYIKKGANGVLGGKVAFEEGTLPIIGRARQFHKCDDKAECDQCPPEKEDALREKIEEYVLDMKKKTSE